MRETATTEYVDYFQVLGIGRRITWIDLWNKIAESASWEMSVTLPYHVNAGFADVIVYKKGEENVKVAFYKVPVKLIINKDGDLDETCLAYQLIQVVKKNKLFNKKRSDKDQELLISLRKKRDSLSVKINDWRKKGKDVSDLIREQESLREQIKNL